MEKCCFSGLIFCSLFLVAAQTIGQNAGPDKAPVTDTATARRAFYATIRNDEVNRQVVILHWSTHDLADVDRYMIEKSTDSNGRQHLSG